MVISLILIFLKISKMEMLSTSGKIKFKFNRTVQENTVAYRLEQNVQEIKRKYILGGVQTRKLK